MEPNVSALPPAAPSHQRKRTLWRGSHSPSFRASKQQKEGTVTDKPSGAERNRQGCQKREAFFLSSFRFHRASLPNSSGDMAKTLEKSSADRCLCGDMGNGMTYGGSLYSLKVKGSLTGWPLPPCPASFSHTSSLMRSTPGGSLVLPLLVTTSIS